MLTNENIQYNQRHFITSREARDNIKNTLNIRLLAESDQEKKEEIQTLLKHL
jgi:hypothetical protein